jgi:D-alanine transaminase
MNDPLVYLNGAMTPLSEAKISVLDRGFIFGDGIYEVIPVYGRKMFRADQHLARLFRSLDAIGINNPHSKEEWLALIAKVMDAHEADDQMVYLQITRGVANAHAYPKDVTPTVFIMTNPIVMPSAEAREHGVACVSMEDLRWLHCEIKSISLLGNVFAAQNAAEHGVTETIQFRNGYLTEASSSNVWIVKDGVLMGPPKDNQILEGIRYALIEEICAANHIRSKPAASPGTKYLQQMKSCCRPRRKKCLPSSNLTIRLLEMACPAHLQATVCRISISQSGVSAAYFHFFMNSGMQKRRPAR